MTEFKGVEIQWDFRPEKHSPLSRGDALIVFASRKAPSEKLQRKYQNTSHFKGLTAKMVEHYRSCVLCNKTKNLVVHHRHYRSLFFEDPHKDVTLLCQRCHGKHHRGRR